MDAFNQYAYFIRAEKNFRSLQENLARSAVNQSARTIVAIIKTSKCRRFLRTQRANLVPRVLSLLRESSERTLGTRLSKGLSSYEPGDQAGSMPGRISLSVHMGNFSPVDRDEIQES